MKTEDSGEDIKVGDTVWAKFEVEEIEPCPGDHGTARVVYRPRPGHHEYAAKSIATIFLWRDDDMEEELIQPRLHGPQRAPCDSCLLWREVASRRPGNMIVLLLAAMCLLLGYLYGAGL